MVNHGSVHLPSCKNKTQKIQNTIQKRSHQLHFLFYQFYIVPDLARKKNVLIPNSILPVLHDYSLSH